MRYQDPRTTPPPAPVNGCKWLPLTKGLFALIDESDFPWACRFTWTAMICKRTAYAYYRRRQNGKYPCYLLHRLLLNAPQGMQVDHINGDGLDCRRSNIRLCSVKENHRNVRKSVKAMHSKFKGVTWDKARSKWFAKIKVNGKTINLGRFSQELDAARSYDTAAMASFGRFANLNCPTAAV